LYANTVPLRSGGGVSLKARLDQAGEPGPRAEGLRSEVQAAAAKTSRFAMMTGNAPISAPYVTQSKAPSIWIPRNREGLAKKYEATNTQVAAHPRHSTQK
jgi:hypothetical protein